MSDQSQSPFDEPLDRAHHDIFQRHIFGAAFPFPADPTDSAPGDVASPGDSGVPADALHKHGREATGSDIFNPVGSICMFGGSTIPEGWLLCDGGTANRVGDADLFGVIGTAYGPGDGSTTFNVPNLKGRLPVGVDGVTFNLGTTGSVDGDAGVVNVGLLGLNFIIKK